MILSICICTFERSQSLATTLHSIVQAVAGLSDVEIVIVDNNSHDDTRRSVTQLSARLAATLPIHYHFEGRQGLAIARNTAVRASSGALLLFTDDDTLWHEPSVRALLADASAHPQAGFFGGRMLAQWPAKPPSWLHEPGLDLLAGVIGHYDPAGESRALTASDPLPFGANFAVRRELLDDVGGFDETLGVIGDRRGRGEETDLLRRAMARGHSGRYVAGMFCLHRVNPRNLQLSRLYEVGVEKGLKVDEPRRTMVQARCKQTMYAIRGLVQLIKGRGDRFRQCVICMGIEKGLMQREHD